MNHNVEVFYVTAFLWKNYNAASKAKKDVEVLLRSSNFNEIRLFRGGLDAKFRVPNVLEVVKLLSTKKYQTSTVIFQNGTGADVIIAPLLKKAFKAGKRIIFVHDVESLRYGRSLDRKREKLVFSHFTHMICPNEAMANFVRSELGFTGKLYCYEVFDYLTADLSYLEKKKTAFPEDGKFQIAYAGNLSYWKSAFLWQILERVNPKNFVLNLYGAGFQGRTKEGVLEYKGVVPSDELPLRLTEHFGLVWDGEDVATVSGNTGHYLLYTYPHKASLYIVSGLPLIVPRKAALHEVVKKYNIGLGVDSLLELDEVFAKLTPLEYELMKENVMKLARKVANGEFISSVLDKVLRDD